MTAFDGERHSVGRTGVPFVGFWLEAPHAG